MHDCTYSMYMIAPVVMYCTVPVVRGGRTRDTVPRCHHSCVPPVEWRWGAPEAAANATLWATHLCQGPRPEGGHFPHSCHGYVRRCLGSYWTAWAACTRTYMAQRLRMCVYHSRGVVDPGCARDHVRIGNTERREFVSKKKKPTAVLSKNCAHFFREHTQYGSELAWLTVFKRGQGVGGNGDWAGKG